MKFRKSVTTFAIAVSAVSAGEISAQDAATQSPIAARQAITTNPLNVILGHFYVEYERAISAPATVAVSASTFGAFDAGRVASIKGKYRHYLSGEAFTGVAFTGTGGIMYASGQGVECHEGSCDENVERDVLPLGGLEIGYTWRLGERENILITPNIGAMRVFGDVAGANFSFAWPTSGVSVSYAF